MHLNDDELIRFAQGEPLLEDRVAHLRQCAECARATREMTAIFVHTRAPGERPSADFDRSMAARLDAIDTKRPVWGWRIPFAVAVACVLVSWMVPPPASDAPAAASAAVVAASDFEMLETLDLLETLDDAALLAEVEVQGLEEVLPDLDAIRSLPEEEG